MRKMRNSFKCVISESAMKSFIMHSRMLELMLTFQLHSKDLPVIPSHRRVPVGDHIAAEFGVSEPTLLFCSEGRLGIGTECRSGPDEFRVRRRYASLGLVN